MVQQVKTPALSLQCLGSLLWYGSDPWRELPNAVGMAKKPKLRTLVIEMLDTSF